MMKTYYMLTKPGIILGNVITTAAGFALASKGHFDYWLFLATLVGLCLIIAAAGVFNNYLDRFIDAKMARTKNRPLATGTIPVSKALYFGGLLTVAGVAILAFFTNLLTVTVALVGLFIYLVLYAFFKYRSFYGTLVGSLAGGIPPVVGYCAVSNHFDLGAFILFMIVVVWQMPHFFAIAIYRLEDYKAASIPVLPVEKGIYATKIQTCLYIVAFIFTTLMLTVTGYTGYIFASATTILGLIWLALSLNGFKQEPQSDKAWAYQMFVYSLIVIMGLCVIIPLDVQI